MSGSTNGVFGAAPKHDAQHEREHRRLAALVRGEWSIENRDHYVRDVTLGEDR
ncbi:hypothetical protein [Actinomadura sp. 6N118]|uniref:hypothetical protein n=1 Tax=Actinomadura sp. 6N118 TaxID=3375151 RepID=UPI00379F0FE4